MNYLPTIYTEFILREIEELEGININHTALMANSESILQEIVVVVRQHSCTDGLDMNVKKTKVMHVTKAPYAGPCPPKGYMGYSPRSPAVKGKSDKSERKERMKIDYQGTQGPLKYISPKPRTPLTRPCPDETITIKVEDVNLEKVGYINSNTQAPK